MAEQSSHLNQAANKLSETEDPLRRKFAATRASNERSNMIPAKASAQVFPPQRLVGVSGAGHDAQMSPTFYRDIAFSWTTHG
jgi:hypothetical protein